jgi:hypothetical protein
MPDIITVMAPSILNYGTNTLLAGFPSATYIGYPLIGTSYANSFMCFVSWYHQLSRSVMNGSGM